MHFVHLKPGSLRLHPATRVLKAEDYQSLSRAQDCLAQAQQQAQELLRNAEQQAQGLLDAAQQEYAKQQQQGYADGMQAGKMDMAEQLITTAERTVAYFAQVEEQVANLIITALRKILGEFDDVERTLCVARNALQIVRNQPRITLRVPPPQEAALRQRINELLVGFSQIGLVEVVADPRLRSGDCILETEIGVVDASIEVQLQAMERAFKRRLGRS